MSVRVDHLLTGKCQQCDAQNSMHVDKECPGDINEAISSLVFAAARCAELPELQMLRKLFGERYGHDFAASAVELFPGNHVNQQISEKLALKAVSKDAKEKLIEEIASEYNVSQQLDALRKNGSILGKELFEMAPNVCHGDASIIASNEGLSQTDPQEHVKHLGTCQVDASQTLASLKMLTSPCKFCQSSDVTNSTTIVRHYGPGDLGINVSSDILPLDREWTPQELSKSDFHCRFDRGRSRSSLKHFGKGNRSSKEKSKKRSVPSQNKLCNGCVTNNDLHGKETSRKLLRDAHQGQEYPSLPVSKEIGDGMLYYEDASDSSDVDIFVVDGCKRTKANRIDMNKKNLLAKGQTVQIKEHSDMSDELDSGCFCEMTHEKATHRCKYSGRSNADLDCCLDHPCYFLASDSDEMNSKTSTMSVIDSNGDRNATHALCNMNANRKQQQDTNLSEGAREESTVMVCQSDCCRSHKQGAGEHAEIRKPKLPPYIAITNPVVPTKIIASNDTVQSASFSHVHPKLPDYDELEAIFTALKEHVNGAAHLAANV